MEVGFVLTELRLVLITVLVAATIMAILESTDIPTCNTLFTIDEETGMTGALNLRRNPADKCVEHGYRRR
jgi:hypothetical protein